MPSKTGGELSTAARSSRRVSSPPAAPGSIKMPEVKAFLKACSKSELKEVESFIAFLALTEDDAKAAAHRSPSSDRWEGVLLDLVNEHLAQLMGVRPIPFNVFARTSTYKALQEGVVYLEMFEQAARVEPAGPQRKALWRVCVSLWARRVLSLPSVPLSARTMLQQAEHTAGLFDQSFPGYLATGRVDWVLRQQVRKD